MSLYVFQDQVSTAATELIAQEVDKFNAALGGEVVMVSEEHIGDYTEQTSWQLIGQLAQRRNAYGDGDVSPTEMGQLLDRMVKVDGKIKPITITPTMLKRLGKNVAEASAVVAAQAAQAIMQDYLNASVAALKTAIGCLPLSCASSILRAVSYGEMWKLSEFLILLCYLGAFLAGTYVYTIKKKSL